jgi:hypothetical protein
VGGDDEVIFVEWCKKTQRTNIEKYAGMDRYL